MATRYARFAIPAIAAGARTGPLNVPTFDDASPRRLVGFLMTNQTKLIHVQIDVAGRVIADIDGGVQAQQRDWIPLDQDYPVGVFLSVNVINDSAGALAVATDAIVLKYQSTGAAPPPAPAPGA